jgi:hypothetical protein
MMNMSSRQGARGHTRAKASTSPNTTVVAQTTGKLKFVFPNNQPDSLEMQPHMPPQRHGNDEYVKSTRHPRSYARKGVDVSNNHGSRANNRQIKIRFFQQPTGLTWNPATHAFPKAWEWRICQVDKAPEVIRARKHRRLTPPR